MVFGSHHTSLVDCVAPFLKNRKFIKKNVLSMQVFEIHGMQIRQMPLIITGISFRFGLFSLLSGTTRHFTISSIRKSIHTTFLRKRSTTKLRNTTSLTHSNKISHSIQKSGLFLVCRNMLFRNNVGSAKSAPLFSVNALLMQTKNRQPT